MSLIVCPECGKEVSSTAQTCPNCGYGVKKHYDRIESKRISKIRKGKLKKALPYIISSVIVFGVFTTSYAVLSQRKLFKNESDMMTYLKSNRYWKKENTKSYLYLLSDPNEYNEYLAFRNDNFGEYISKIWSHGDQLEMSPWLGTFKLGISKYIIAHDGRIIENKDSYKSCSSLSSSFEDPLECLLLDPVRSDVVEDDRVEVEIHVTNTGKKAYDSIRLETTLLGENGESLVLDDYEIVKNSKDDSYMLKSGDVGVCNFDFTIPFELENISTRILYYSSPVLSYDW